MRGVPGSGKTTIAKGWVAENPVFRVRASRDDLRSMLFGGWTGRGEDEDMVSALVIQAIGKAFERYRDIVVDATNTNPEHLDMIKRWAEQLGNYRHIEFSVWDVPTPMEECVRRDSQRELPVGRAVIERMQSQLDACADWKPELGVRLVKHQF